jgi:hypothetical protein
MRSPTFCASMVETERFPHKTARYPVQTIALELEARRDVHRRFPYYKVTYRPAYLDTGHIFHAPHQDEGRIDRR